MDDMLLRFSRKQRLVANKAIQTCWRVLDRRLNGDVKHDVLKLWGVVLNQPGPSTAGIQAHFWTSYDGETWKELGAFPLVTNLEPGSYIMAGRVPEGLQRYLAVTYELVGTFETAPVVEAGLVEKLDDVDLGKEIVMQGGYRDLGRIEDLQAAVRELQRKMTDEGLEVPPVEEPEPEPEGGGGGGSGGGGGGTPA